MHDKSGFKEDNKQYILNENKNRRVCKPPEPNRAVATPDTKRTTLGSMRRNWKSPKSTFNMVCHISHPDI